MWLRTFLQSDFVVLDLKRTEEVRVRLTSTEMQLLRERAYRAKLPRAVFARRMALGESVLADAPPARDELPEIARHLLKIIAATNSNLTQISSYCTGAQQGSPLLALAGVHGPLAAFQLRLLDVGLQIKRAQLSFTEMSVLLEKIEPAADQLNSLAREINVDEHPATASFAQALEALQEALQ